MVVATCPLFRAECRFSLGSRVPAWGAWVPWCRAGWACSWCAARRGGCGIIRVDRAFRVDRVPPGGPDPPGRPFPPRCLPGPGAGGAPGPQGRAGAGRTGGSGGRGRPRSAGPSATAAPPAASPPRAGSPSRSSPPTASTPLGYAAFGFALGVAAGALIRRTIPAMAVTLAIFAALQVAMPLWVRPTSPRPTTWSSPSPHCTRPGTDRPERQHLYPPRRELRPRPARRLAPVQRTRQRRRAASQHHPGLLHRAID